MLVEDSPAVKGGMQIGDVLLSINGKDVRGMMFRDIISITRSDSPKTMDFIVLRGNSEVKLKLSNTPASALSGKKSVYGDAYKLDPHMVQTKVTVKADYNQVDPNNDSAGNIINNEVAIRIRYAGETWWMYDQIHKLNSEGRISPTDIPLVIDYTRTIYVEMVYRYHNGKYYGDYEYKRGSDLILNNGSEVVNLMHWGRFTRDQSYPDWETLLGKNYQARGSIWFFVNDAGLNYYRSQGYQFPDKAHLTISGSDGKAFYDQDVPVKTNNDKFWIIDYNDTAYRGPELPNESDISIVLIIPFIKDGKEVPVSLQVRETLFTRRTNADMFLSNPIKYRYNIDAEGQLTKKAFQ